MEFKGIIHVHSNFSYDGHHSIDEIAQFARGRGYSFVGMSEHSDTLDADKVTLYLNECQRVSRPDCLVIPGIEFSCEKDLHLVGLGVHHYTNSKDPLQVSEFIQRQGGVAVVAHPGRYNYRIPVELAATLDGIEIWNAGYDGRFVPNEHSMNLLKDFRKRNGSILAFGGQDLHWITNHSHVQLIVFCESLTETAIVKAIKRGDYMISGRYFQVSARIEESPLKMARIVTARRTYDLAKGTRDFVKFRSET